MERIIEKKYDVKFILKSPLHISSGKGGSEYNEMLKYENLPIIPGSTVKGKLKENFMGLIDKMCTNNGEGYCNCPVCNIFGNAGYQPARIFVEDFMLKDKECAASIRPRVSIDRYLKTAIDGGISNTEVVEEGTFEGNIKVFFTDKTQKYERKLITALKMIDSIGGGKSRGFGFVNVEVKAFE